MYDVLGYYIHKDDKELLPAFVMVVIDDGSYDLTCYAPVGQHGSMSRDYFDECRPITKEEYLKASEGIYTPAEYLLDKMEFWYEESDEENPAFGDFHHSWKVYLDYQGRSIEVPFFTGSRAGEPDVHMVLYSLLSDSTAKDYDTYEGFADEFGYDHDSRAGERIYRACLENAKKLHYLLGDDYNTFAEKYKDF